MSSLGGRDGRLSRLHAVEKIPMMIVGLIELHLAHLFGQLFVIAPVLVRGIECATVHPDPAISADPFGAAADIRMPASDRHHDVLRIFEFDAILVAGVPYAILEIGR